MKIAILNDYLQLALASADWSQLPGDCEITVFDSALAYVDDAAAVLAPHQGHNVREFYEVAYADVVENIKAFLVGTPIRLLDAERNASRFAA